MCATKTIIFSFFLIFFGRQIVCRISTLFEAAPLFLLINPFKMAQQTMPMPDLSNAIVAQDEMGRPFIIVREYVSNR